MAKFKIGDKVRIIPEEGTGHLSVGGDMTAFNSVWEVIIGSFHQSGTYVRIKRLEFPRYSVNMGCFSSVYLSETIIDIKHLRPHKNALQRLKERLLQ